jgi:hypothetical protein
MKHVLLFLFLLSSFFLHGQQKKSKRVIYFFKVQGSFLFDAHPKNDYAGINLINLSWERQKNQILQGIDIELISYKSDA